MHLVLLHGYLLQGTGSIIYAANIAKDWQNQGVRATSRPGCFQKENAYLLGALEIIRLVEEAEENFYKLSQGCFPLAALRHVSGRRPKWAVTTISIKTRLNILNVVWRLS